MPSDNNPASFKNKRLLGMKINLVFTQVLKCSGEFRANFEIFFIAFEYLP